MLRGYLLSIFCVRSIGLVFGVVLGACALIGCNRQKGDGPGDVERVERPAPRTWRSERLGFEVTIPSERWAERDNPNVLAQFGAADFMAIVAEARPARTDAEWQAAVQFAKGTRVGTSVNVDERSGHNPNGHEYWMSVGDVRDGSASYFLGVAVTRVREMAVIMMFEGKPQSDSRDADVRRSQAIQFLSSVK